MAPKKPKTTSAWKTCSRGHSFSGPGHCPVCWPNGRKGTNAGRKPKPG
jgi:hypothetical protein